MPIGKRFYDTLSVLNPFRSRINYLRDDGNPRTIIASGGKGLFKLKPEKRSSTLLEKYWTYYNREGTVWAAINSIAFNTVMVGYTLHSDIPEAKKVISNFCKRVNLDTHLLDNVIYALVLGDSFMEIIYKKNSRDISRLKDIDPKTMVINYNKYGEVETYQQVILGKKQPPIGKEYICHIKLFSRPDSPYGISIIEPSKDTIDRKVRTDEALANAIIRHGTSKYIATIGTAEEKQLPPESILKEIKEELEDIDEKNEFVVPWNVKIETIDERGIQGVEEYFNYFQSQVVLGLLCPEEALGLGRGATEATSRVKAILYERMIKSFQLRISRIIEHELFNKVLRANGLPENSVEIVFNSVTEEDEALKAKWIGNLLRGFQRSTIKPFTINEIRSFFGYKPVNIPLADRLIYGYDEIKKDEDEYD